MPLILRRSGPMCCAALVALLTLLPRWDRVAFADDPGRTETAATPQPVVTAIGVVQSTAGTQITISGDAELGYEYFVIEGRSLAVDIPGARSAVWPAEQALDDDFVGSIRVAEQAGEKPGVRVAVSLKGPGDFTVRGEKGAIVIFFPAGREGGSPEHPQLNRVAEIVATPLTNSFRVAVETDAKPSYRILESGDEKRVVIAIDGAWLEPDSRKAVDYSRLGTPVTRVAAWTDPQDPAVVLVAVDLRQPLPFRVFTDRAGLNLDFSRNVSDRPVPSPAEPAAPPLTPGSTRAAAPVASSSEPTTTVKAYSGRKITIDFVDADIADIFRLIADVSGISIVATDDVKGKRSVKLTGVPWDQALDLILKTNLPELVRIDESDAIIRVTTLQRVLDEEAAAEKRRIEQVQRTLAEQKQGLERAEFARKIEAENQRQLLERVKADRQRSKGWMERTFVVSYGDTKEVATRLEKFYSGCKDGCVFEAGERSKSIFVRDFVDNVEQMNAVFVALESPTSAVMVEARIVEVLSDYSEAIGIQWGGNFVADGAHGNATNYAFPNSIGIGGTQAGNYLVNLPAVAPVSGVGISLGHIANTLSLDVRLSALEKLGKTKILSNPKVLVIQNEEANINVGSQLPVPKTDTEGNRSVEWKDVGILLNVTPNVTSDGRVFMKVKIEKSSPGETVKTTEGEMFSIERRGAETKVLVGDGETSVIGGIFQQTDVTSGDGVPGLSRLPLIGWLFKSRSSSNKRTELMIFLTPRIVDNFARLDTAGRRESAARRERVTKPLAPADDLPSGGDRGLFGAVGIVSSNLPPTGNEVRAVVNYTNDTTFTFTSSVTINCRAVGREGLVVGAENGYIHARDTGPIGPGFQRELELSIPLSGSGYTALQCTALAAE